MHLTTMSVSNRADKFQVFGLIALQGHVLGDAEPIARVQVEIAGHSRAFSADEVVVAGENGTQRIMINILSHLLPNGPATANVKVEFSDESTACFDGLSLLIANFGELADQVASDMHAHSTPAILPREIDSAMFPYADGKARAWFDAIEPENVPLSFDASANLEDAHRHLERWGFCILPDTLPGAMIGQFKVELEAAIASGELPYEQGSSQRIHNAHRLAAGRQIWLYPPVLSFLKSHFRDTPCACQTLTYVHGSEQRPHQDTIHLTPYPAGYMCGVWIALEDVQPGTGELDIYPGSHKLPRLRAGALGLAKVDEDYSSYQIFDAAVQRLLTENGHESHLYRPKAGQILVWHENLVHGGSPRQFREKTRLSIVSHYFAQGAAAYFDSRGVAASLEILPNLG
jgi:hypothetical protein